MSPIATPWFDVDKKGLAALQERRGRAHAVIELIANCWDQNVTAVHVSLRHIDRGLADLRVEDDDPDGFSDLSHAYTLYAHTAKRHNATVRGRFNLGEKLVLALCTEASIASTKGTVVFAEDGRLTDTRRKRDAGSCFSAKIRLTKDDIDEVGRLVLSLIPPRGVLTTYNDRVVPEREPVHTFEATLLTEIAGEDDVLRRSPRKTTVEVYEPLAGEVPSLFEMGVPVVETGDRWHLTVNQKIPLNVDRDNVTPAYLRKLRTLVMNEMHDQLVPEDTTSVWVREAMASPDIAVEAVEKAVTLRYGEKRVVFDPNDPEANKIAAAHDYTVIGPRAYSKEEWANIRAAGAVVPAGRVTPSNSMLHTSLNGTPPVPQDEWTPGMHRLARYSRWMAGELLGCSISVEYHKSTDSYLAAYGNRRLTFNMRRLGKAFIEETEVNREAVDELLLHELGHHYGGHLDASYHKALTRMGARLRRLPLNGGVG